MIPALQNNLALERRRLGNQTRRKEAVSARDRTVSECSIPHCPMLDAVEGLVKRYYAQLGYINNSVWAHSNRDSNTLHNTYRLYRKPSHHAHCVGLYFHFNRVLLMVVHKGIALPCCSTPSTITLVSSFHMLSCKTLI